MNELVHSIIRKSPLSSLRPPSFAGRGLPERMRSTAFALLGLTAAAGLALVAIFAQPGSSLLEPAPLPAEPVTHLAGAERVTHPDGPEHLVAAKPAVGVERTSAAGDRGPVENGGSPAVPEPVQSSPATSAPVVPPSPATPEAGHGSGSRGTASQPAPSTSPASSPGTAESPASSAADGSTSPASPPVTQPVPTPPKATTSSPTAPQPVAPGNSSSGAAAEHAGERGIEASAASTASAAPSAAPQTESSPGNGNGYAKGHDK